MVTAPTQDDLIKNLLLQPRLLQDFLHAFLPEVFEFADFEVLEYLDKEHPRTGRKPRRRGDLLIKVRWKAQEGMFLIHIESQGQAQDIIVQRAAEYCLRDSIQYRLPVMPLVLLTYPGQRDLVQDKLDWRFGKLASIQVKCPILHFHQMDPKPHLKGKNLAALAMANVMKITSGQRVDAIVRLLAESLRHTLSPTEEGALVEFATTVKELSETQLLQLDEKITTMSRNNKRLARMPKLINPFVEIGKIKGRQEGLQKGLQKGRQEGRQEGEVVVVVRLLKKKFPKLSAKLVAQVAQFDEETLLSFGEALLFMQTPADCTAWLKAKR
jgi:hypothetical protein